MKKLALLSPILGYLAYPVVALAAAESKVDVGINAPAQGVDPGISVGTLLSNSLTIIFVAAALIVLFMLVWGAFQWIMSGGDKEKVTQARGRITQALVGLAILALAFVITRVIGQVVNIDILNLKFLPTLTGCGNGQILNPQTGACGPIVVTATPTPIPGR